MKKNLLFLSLFLISISASAQSQNQYPYSAGFRILSINEYSKLMNEARSTVNYRVCEFNGLIFKFNDNQISYRVQGDYYEESDYSFYNNCETCEEVKGSFKEVSVKLGFEKNIVYGLIQPFWGADLGFKKISFDGAAYTATSGAMLYDALVEKTGALIYPFIGLKTNFLSGHVTLSAEAGLDILYSYDKETKTYSDNSFTSNDFRRWGFYNKPLGLLSLQYNFGEN